MFIKIPIRKRQDFLKNNYKTQKISLVSKRFKLISFIRIRVKWTLFRKNWCGENMEIEFNELGFHVQQPSSMYSVSMYRNQGCWTRFPYIETEFIELGFHTWKSSSLNFVSGRSFNGWNFWRWSCFIFGHSLSSPWEGYTGIWKPSSLNLISGRSFNGWNFWRWSCFIFWHSLSSPWEGYAGIFFYISFGSFI